MKHPESFVNYASKEWLRPETDFADLYSKTNLENDGDGAIRNGPVLGFPIIE
jgi:hypothetical protein